MADDSSVSADEVPYHKPDKKLGKNAQKDVVEEVEEEDEDMDEDEYVVEKIVGHRFDADKTLKFNVKWQGWDETTWEPKENLVGCPDEVNAYYAEIGGEPVFRSSRGRPTSSTPKASPAPTTSKKRKASELEATPAATSSGRGRKQGTKPAELKGAHVPDGNVRRPPQGSWENHIAEVVTIEKDANGDVYGLLLWSSGFRSRHAVQVCHQKCPQKMLNFYSAHLQFNTPPTPVPSKEGAAAATGTNGDTSIEVPGNVTAGASSLQGNRDPEEEERDEDDDDDDDDDGDEAGAGADADADMQGVAEEMAGVKGVAMRS